MRRGEDISEYPLCPDAGIHLVREGVNVTSIEKRKLLDLIYRLVRYDLLSETDVNKILDICGAAVERLIKKA